MTTTTGEDQARAAVGGAAIRVAAFAGLWWTLTEGAAGSWLVGVPAVIAATWASCLLRADGNGRWRLVGAVRFAAFFVAQSLRAGVDVARRAVTLDIAPRIITYETSLQHRAARTLFSGAVSLLPGTLTTETVDATLHVHTLDHRQAVVEELRRLEDRIAAMYGERVRCGEQA